MSKSGQQLGPYRILDRLGQGGSSEVFSAKGPWGKLIALKIQRRPRKRRRFMQEFKILNKNLHPLLIDVYEFGMLDIGWSYLIMEMIEGKSATAYARNFYGKERLWKSVLIAARVSESFGALHDIGWIHGDLKSKNILVSADGFPHLIDFELARPIQSTGSGKFFGTRSYAPPEQHDGLQLTTSVDVYSMAGVLCRMISNQLPYESVDNDKQAKHRRKNKPKISKRYPTELRDLLVSALNSDPKKRPQNGKEFAAALRRCIPSRYSENVENTPSLPGLIPIQATLRQNDLQPELHILDIIDLAGGDPTLVSRFAYNQAQTGEWVPREYKEQVWYYLKQLPTEVQSALFFLASVGGMATSSAIYKFTGTPKKHFEEWFRKIPHWIRKEENRWHLFVGAVHEACRYLMEQENGIQQLKDIRKTLPKWSRMFVDQWEDPEKILIPFQNWVLGNANTLFQWRMLRQLQECNYQITMLERLLLLRRNGDWFEALNIQQTTEAFTLLKCYENISSDNISELEMLIESNNIDVSFAARAILAEWKILHAEFQEAEILLYPLCWHEDPYPQLLGLQQRTLLYHNLHQRARQRITYEKIDQLSTYPMTARIKQMLAKGKWISNLISLDKISSPYLSALQAIHTKKDPTKFIQLFSKTTSVTNRATLSVHPLWASYVEHLSLPKQPTDQEFRFQFDPSEDFTCISSPSTAGQASAPRKS
jgi:serine/threonine protein kinase